MVTTDQSRRQTVPAGWADPAPVRADVGAARRWLPLLLWLACLGAGTALLLALGDGRLAAPPLTDPAAWPGWASGRDPLEVAMVVLRLLALACAWYLVGVTSVSVLARVLRAASLVRVADALSVGPVRTVVQQALGIGLAAGVLVSVVPTAPTTARTAAANRSEDVAVMVALEEGTDAHAAEGDGDAGVVRVADGVEAAAPAAEDGPETNGAIDDVPVPAPAAMSTAAASPVGTTNSVTPTTVTEVASMASSEMAGAREVRISAGDHFWGLAEQAVSDHLGRPATDEEVHPYWEAMVEANADRLTVPGNPDLLVPGQRVLVPDVSEVLR